MGYTRYWETTSKCEGGFSTKFVGDVRKMLVVTESLGISISGWDGMSEVEITSKYISFNGSALLGEDHEPFALGVDSRGPRFNFCKTAMKPYDSFVLAVLLYAGDCGYIKELATDGENGLGTVLEILVRTLGFDKTFKIVQNSAKFYSSDYRGEQSVLLSMLSQMKQGGAL